MYSTGFFFAGGGGRDLHRLWVSGIRKNVRRSDDWRYTSSHVSHISQPPLSISPALGKTTVSHPIQRPNRPSLPFQPPWFPHTHPTPYTSPPANKPVNAYILGHRSPMPTPPTNHHLPSNLHPPLAHFPRPPTSHHPLSAAHTPLWKQKKKQTTDKCNSKLACVLHNSCPHRQHALQPQDPSGEHAATNARSKLHPNLPAPVAPPLPSPPPPPAAAAAHRDKLIAAASAAALRLSLRPTGRTHAINESVWQDVGRASLTLGEIRMGKDSGESEGRVLTQVKWRRRRKKGLMLLWGWWWRGGKRIERWGR
jgi:hypothetical protein